MKKHLASVAASSLSASDAAAHIAASHVRSGFSRAGEEALSRSFAATQRILREQYDEALKERGLAEYEEYMADAA